MFKTENNMIAHIEGILESKLPNQVIIDVNGIGYLLHISLNTFENLPSKGKLRLFSHQLCYFICNKKTHVIVYCSTS